MYKNREEYWNNGYLEYWKEKVEQSNDEKAKDKTTKNEIIYKYIDNVNLMQNEKVLDFGCGYCRIYPYIKNRGAHYYGIDISDQMIKNSLNNFPELKEKLFVSEGEQLPFGDNQFDKIFCFGVFDACYQEEALYEILRVLNISGTAFITGKNINYCLDDQEACIAEVNARKKGHPNYFTDLNEMISQLEEKKFIIKEVYCFKYRGDFSNDNYRKIIEDRFYEYGIYIYKTEQSLLTKFSIFSNEYSKTNI